ncbi:MAG: DUF6056 family protein [Spirochaetaceae bacterium]|jgi:hypothetical protein|nr:DUF6056 family protein [Spirochaetaceae bacterium]
MTNKRILPKIAGALMIVFPILFFFLFNTLTPYWWDDFPNACFTVSWYTPRERLIGSFQDMIQSTGNLFTNPTLAGNGRVFINFLQFVFCAPKNKIIFDVCNTIVYSLFIMLICYHSFGSFKKIAPSAFLFVNIAIWLLTPAWGQDFLWLTGSLNYLWSLTLALLFLVPYRKKYVDNTYTQKIILSIPLFVLGVITGWGMQNAAGGICVLLIGYFIRKFFRKEKICLFEVLGTGGILTGFCFLLSASTGQFSGIKEMVFNFAKSPVDFIYYCGVPVCIVVVMGVEIFWFRKNKVDVLPFGCFLTALVSFFSLAIGYIKERALLVPVVFFIIAGLYLLRSFHETPKRYWIFVYTVVFCIFIPSFYNGGKDIVKSYLLSKAREEFIYAERERCVSDVYVKTPIPVQDSHSGLSDGLDILSNPDDHQYKIHNTAKSLFYGVRSLTGIEADTATHLKDSFKAFFNEPSKEQRSIKNLFLTIYQNWESK